MAIANFNTTSGEDAVSLLAFSEFEFGPPAFGDRKGAVTAQNQSPPTSEGSDDSSTVTLVDGGAEDDDDDSISEDGEKKRGSATAGPPTKRGKASCAQRRATHNAIERARRESLNGRFLELAGALPTMANVKRPSKSIIVNKSLEWIYESQIRERSLVNENDALRAELNEMRARLRMGPLPARSPLHPVSDQAGNSQIGAVHSQPATMSFQRQAPMNIGADGYFSSVVNANSLPAVHQHPMNFAGFGTMSHAMPPPSAATSMMAFSSPFPSILGVSDATLAGAGSPGGQSETGSDAPSGVHTANVSDPEVGRGTHLDKTFMPASQPSPVGESIFGSLSFPPEKMAATTLGSSVAGLQSPYSQQQQYAALAAVATSHPHQPAAVNWALMF